MDGLVRLHNDSYSEHISEFLLFISPGRSSSLLVIGSYFSAPSDELNLILDLRVLCLATKTGIVDSQSIFVVGMDKQKGKSEPVGNGMSKKVAGR